MSVITVYSKPDCHLCVKAMQTLREFQHDFHFELVEKDITTDEKSHRAYFERIPVILLDGEELFEFVIDQWILRQTLHQAGKARLKQDVSGGHPLESRR